MTENDEIVEGPAFPVQSDPDEARDRKRAKAVVHGALLSASTPLDNRGLSKRLLPGLWNAAVNVLIAQLTAEDAVALLADRRLGVEGTAENASAPPRVLTGKALEAYRDETVRAGETVMEVLMGALDTLEEEGLEDWFPETVLDSVIIVLLRGWGPDHVRRALEEQAALLVNGTLLPANFMEPSHILSARSVTAPREPKEAKAPPPPAAPEPAPAASPFVRRPPAQVRISAYVHADAADDGTAAWAFTMRALWEGGEEERLAAGTLRDPSGRMRWTEALKACLSAVTASADSVSAVIDVSSQEAARAAAGEETLRFPGQEEFWDALDRETERNRIQFRYREHGLAHDDAERCDRKVRALIAAASGG